jgi:N6-adenosine-specific RNA methylase IME4
MSVPYSLIYADPPWKFATYSQKGLGRSAEAWYDCMTLSQIKALNVNQLAALDAVLLLWTTDPFLQLAFDVIKAWGFTYKTVGFYWVKEPTSWFGTGYWTRANPEQCLLATRGHPKRLNADVPKLIMAPRRAHSQKPDEAYERIERLAAGPYLEMFARTRRPGWDVCFSNEADTGPAQERRFSSKGGDDATSLPIRLRAAVARAH